MGVQRDGSTSRGAAINDEGQAVVRAIGESELEHASASGNAYSWASGELDIAVNATMLFVQNTGGVLLILDRAIIVGGNVACLWDVHLTTESATPAGTAVTGVNLNTQFASVLADAIAKSDETAFAAGSTIFNIKTEVLIPFVLDLDGVILAKNHGIQFDQKTESTSGSVILIGHYENPS